MYELRCLSIHSTLQVLLRHSRDETYRKFDHDFGEFLDVAFVVLAKQRHELQERSEDSICVCMCVCVYECMHACRAATRKDVKHVCRVLHQCVRTLA
jgi:hypothetical protein